MNNDMEFGVVGRAGDGFFRYQAWPTVTRDADGVLYAACSGHRLGHVCPFGVNYLYISRDNGRHWLGPVVVNDTYADDRDAGLCAWGSGNLLLTWFTNPLELYEQKLSDTRPHTAAMRTPLARTVLDLWRGLPIQELAGGSWLRLSRDGGCSWSEPVHIPLTSPHGPVRTPDGRLLFVGRECHWGGPLENGAIYAMESEDDGGTWNLLGAVPCPKGYDWSQVYEPHGIQLSDGTVLAALRVGDKSVPGCLLAWLSRSTDGGRTFSDPVRLDLLGSPPHLMQHSSGAVILTYGRRLEPNGQYARVSYDGGLTWSEELAVSPESPDWDHGYPATVELGDGSLLTVYYQKCPGDDFTSILYTRWKLPD